MYNVHYRKRCDERYFCGRNAKEQYPDYVVQVVEKGIPVHEELLAELMFICFLDTHTRPKLCPIIILEPPGLWNNDIRAKIAASFLLHYCSPSVAYLSSAVAILAG